MSSDTLSDHKRWTETANSYQSVIGKCTLHGTSRLVDVVHHMSPIKNDSRALDVGAGSGTLAVCIIKKNSCARVLATDISQGMLNEIDRLHVNGITTRIEDAVSLSGLKDSSFSHVFTSFAIQFTPNPLACVEGLYRVVEVGGIAGIAIWGEHNDLSTVHDNACKNLKPDYTPASPVTNNAWSSRQEHQKTLEKVGFKHVRTEVIQMPVEFENAERVCDYW